MPDAVPRSEVSGGQTGVAIVGTEAVGALCTVVATGGWGWLLARQLERRPRELGAARAALAVLRTEIEYARTPLPDALERAGRRAEAPVARLFLGAAARLRAGSGIAPGEAWAGALAEADGLSAWCSADLTVLERLGAALGASGADDQVRHIEACGRLVRLQEQGARSGLERKARMWLYLGVLAGAGLILTVGR